MANTELINKKDLLESIYENIYYSDKAIWDGGKCWVRFKDIETEIEEAEIVEERPVAKWSTIIKQNDWLITETRQCTRCGSEPPSEEVKRFNYCPYCGARME